MLINNIIIKLAMFINTVFIIQVMLLFMIILLHVFVMVRFNMLCYIMMFLLPILMVHIDHSKHMFFHFILKVVNYKCYSTFIKEVMKKYNVFKCI